MMGHLTQRQIVALDVWPLQGSASAREIRDGVNSRSRRSTDCVEPLEKTNYREKTGAKYFAVMHRVRP